MGINVEYGLMRHVQRYAKDWYTRFEDYLSRFGVYENVEFFEFRQVDFLFSFCAPLPRR